MSNRQDITIDQGADKTVSFTVYNGSVAPANLLNLTGSTVEFKVSAGSQHFNAITTLNLTNGITLQPTLGIIDVNFTHAITSNIKFIGAMFEGYYQLNLTLPDGTIKRLFHGKLSISRAII